MLREFAEYLGRVGRPEIIKIDEKNYCDKGLKLIGDPKATSLKLSTLDSLVDYLAKEIDTTLKTEVFIVVESPTKVCLHSHLDTNRERECLIEVTPVLPRIDLGYKDQEEFCISLKSNFIQTSVTDQILKLIGNIEEKVVKQSGDDGFSQSVTVKKDVVTIGKETVPSVVELAPYRTFSEIKQPNSEYILRLKEGPRVALIEADGGAWRVEATKRIKAYLEDKLPEMNILA